VLATEVFAWFSVASGRLGVELDLRLVSTLVPPLFVVSTMFLLPLPAELAADFPDKTDVPEATGSEVLEVS